MAKLGDYVSGIVVSSNTLSRDLDEFSPQLTCAILEAAEELYDLLQNAVDISEAQAETERVLADMDKAAKEDRCPACEQPRFMDGSCPCTPLPPAAAVSGEDEEESE